MYEAIKNFHMQFGFIPEIVYGEKLKKSYKRFIVAGMGGSGLAVRLFQAWKPGFPLLLHQGYGLPEIPEEELSQALFIASSYSGNTEEVIDAYKKAREHSLEAAAIDIGGKLLDLAEKDGTPHVILPDTHIQPRAAVGFSFVALLKIFGQGDAIEEASRLKDFLNKPQFESAGEKIAKNIGVAIPVIYASHQNDAVAYDWKVVFNETGKIPAFCNVFSELNHNEIIGYEEMSLAKNFCFIFLKDAGDHPRIQKRMDILENLFRARGLTVHTVQMEGGTRLEKIFSTVLLGNWVAFYIAKIYGHDPENTPIIEEFKKLL